MNREETADGEDLVFGERVPGATWVVRTSVYALIEDGGRVALVRTPRGVYLPGGGLEAGESAEQALRRELLEECGLEVGTLRRIGRAVQLVESVIERTHFEKPSAFYVAEVSGTPRSPSEPDHELVWADRADGVELLSHASHRWAIERLVLERASSNSLTSGTETGSHARARRGDPDGS